MADRKYRIRKNRWETALSEGFEILADDRVRTIQETEDGEPVHAHAIFLKPLDSAGGDSEWGRVFLKAEHGSETAFYIYALALDEGVPGKPEPAELAALLADPEEDRAKKLRVMMELGALRSVNRQDMLLYSIRGRYLFLALDVIGDGVATLSDLTVFMQGDNFMQTFPEVYRERNSFFHRWMSVYSTIYNDLQDRIDDLPKLLDVDTCPAELLPIYASWLGIDISGGFLPEEVCRDLVRDGYQLSRRKGTRWALSRIIEIVLGCEADILEHNTMRGYLLSDGAQIPPNLREGGVLDVTILVHGQIKETLRHQLLFLLDQFKPVRTRLHLVQLDKGATIDGNSYLDMNAAIPEGQPPVLDTNMNMSGVITLR
ncbi:MAG: phage tail protein I [Lachnospiraceae bacterium]|nr:phage tail protein I [Lachnospiraceae bacterium]